MRAELKGVVVAAFACACAFAATAEEHVSKNLERGEPARWFKPDDTPQKREATAKKEAQAALAEALADCRKDAAGRKDCEKQARDQYNTDVQAARTPRGMLVRVAVSPPPPSPRCRSRRSRRRRSCPRRCHPVMATP